MPRVKNVPTTDAEKIEVAISQLISYDLARNSTKVISDRQKRWFKEGMHWIVSNADLSLEALTDKVYWHIIGYVLRPIAAIDNRESRICLSSENIKKILSLKRHRWSLKTLVLPDLVYYLQSKSNNHEEKIKLIAQVFHIMQNAKRGGSLLAFNGRMRNQYNNGCGVMLESELKDVVLQVYGSHVSLVKQAVFELHERFPDDERLQRVCALYTQEMVIDIKKCTQTIFTEETIVNTRNAAKVAVAQKLSADIAEKEGVQRVEPAGVLSNSQETGSRAVAPVTSRVLQVRQPTRGEYTLKKYSQALSLSIRALQKYINISMPTPYHQDKFRSETASLDLQSKENFNDYKQAVLNNICNFLKLPLPSSGLSNRRQWLSIEDCVAVLCIRRSATLKALIIGDLCYYLEKGSDENVVSILNALFNSARSKIANACLITGVRKCGNQYSKDIMSQASHNYNSNILKLIGQILTWCKNHNSDPLSKRIRDYYLKYLNKKKTNPEVVVALKQVGIVKQTSVVVSSALASQVAALGGISKGQKDALRSPAKRRRVPMRGEGTCKHSRADNSVRLRSKPPSVQSSQSEKVDAVDCLLRLSNLLK